MPVVADAMVDDTTVADSSMLEQWLILWLVADANNMLWLLMQTMSDAMVGDANHGTVVGRVVGAPDLLNVPQCSCRIKGVPSIEAVA